MARCSVSVGAMDEHPLIMFPADEVEQTNFAVIA